MSTVVVGVGGGHVLALCFEWSSIHFENVRRDILAINGNKASCLDARQVSVAGR